MNNVNLFTSPGKVAGRLFSLVLTCLLLTGTYAQADEVVFSGSDETPWQLYLGSSSNWMVWFESPETTSFKSKVITVRTIDNVATADAIQAEWRGGLGQVYWQQSDPQDYRMLSEQGGALSMVIRIDKRPKKSVDIKMDCGYPCAGSLNMTKLFKAVPQDTWFRISLKLSCFEDAGANLGNILAPLVVATKGSFKMSISSVALLAQPPQESLIDCG
ncbi:MAG: putative glycoside hydrolase [Lysobacterales bacterium]